MVSALGTQVFCIPRSFSNQRNMPKTGSANKVQKTDVASATFCPMCRLSMLTQSPSPQTCVGHLLRTVSRDQEHSHALTACSRLGKPRRSANLTAQLLVGFHDVFDQPLLKIGHQLLQCVGIAGSKRLFE